MGTEGEFNAWATGEHPPLGVVGDSTGRGEKRLKTSKRQQTKGGGGPEREGKGLLALGARQRKNSRRGGMKLGGARPGKAGNGASGGYPTDTQNSTFGEAEAIRRGKRARAAAPTGGVGKAETQTPKNPAVSRKGKGGCNGMPGDEKRQEVIVERPGKNGIEKRIKPRKVSVAGGCHAESWKDGPVKSVTGHQSRKRGRERTKKKRKFKTGVPGGQLNTP